MRKEGGHIQKISLMCLNFHLIESYGDMTQGSEAPVSRERL